MDRPDKIDFFTRGESFSIDRCLPQLQAIRNGQIDFHAFSHGRYPGKRIDSETLSGVSSIGFWDAVGEPNWGLEAHRNEGIELVLLETGNIVFSVDGDRYDLSAGDLTVTRPWQEHRLGNPNIGPGRLHWVILDVNVRRPDEEWRWPHWVVLSDDNLKELTQKLRLNENPIWRASPEMIHCFREIAHSVQYSDKDCFSRIAIHLNHLLLSLLEVLREQQSKEHPDLITRRRVVRMFFDSLCGHSEGLANAWSLEKMAQACGMRPTVFVTCCHNVANMSPIAYLNRCRLAFAAEQLINRSDLSITDIAFNCGFQSSQYFATRFKKQYGSRPRDYRNRIGQNVDD